MRVLCAFAALFAVALTQFEDDRPCFCKHGEAVESCPCEPLSIDILNNKLIYEKLQSLLQRDFFRYYKVNTDKECPFWPDDRQCGSKECGISTCDDEVPAGLKRPAVITTVRMVGAPAGQKGSGNRTSPLRSNHTGRARTVTVPLVQESGNVAANGACAGAKANDFDPMDRSLSEGEIKQHADWDAHDDLEDKFCEIDDEDCSDMHYVDLTKNPERYTGYKGDSALRVWKSIYQENCFKPDPKFDKNFLTHPNNLAPGGFGSGSWFRNTEMFAGRFGTKWSWEGPQRLRNVYFAYLLELRALLKAAPYLQKELFYTGNEKDDQETKTAVEELLQIIGQHPDHFDEMEMFTGNEAQARELREEFRSHFVNISRIMDCVGCDKCRLWGKVQTHGMGTALKILFSDLPYSHYHNSNHPPGPPFQLTRNEVVSLFQSFGRYSSSIREVGEFRKEMVPNYKDEL